MGPWYRLKLQSLALMKLKKDLENSKFKGLSDYLQQSGYLVNYEQRQQAGPNIYYQVESHIESLINDIKEQKNAVDSITSGFGKLSHDDQQSVGKKSEQGPCYFSSG